MTADVAEFIGDAKKNEKGRGTQNPDGVRMFWRNK